MRIKVITENIPRTEKEWQKYNVYYKWKISLNIMVGLVSALLFFPSGGKKTITSTFLTFSCTDS